MEDDREEDDRDEVEPDPSPRCSVVQKTLVRVTLVVEISIMNWFKARS